MQGHSLPLVLAEAMLVVIPLALSLSVQQYAQARMALALGDDTAKRRGHLTLNPLVHIDPIGTILLPFCLILAQGETTMLPLFGWARPAPLDPQRMRADLSPRVRIALLALGAPLANALLAMLAAVGLVLCWRHPSSEVAPLASLMSRLLSINVALALFQLLPFGPLSGFKLLCAAVPSRLAATLERLNAAAGFYVMLALLVFGRELFGPALRIVAGTLLAVVNRLL